MTNALLLILTDRCIRLLNLRRIGSLLVGLHIWQTLIFVRQVSQRATATVHVHLQVSHHAHLNVMYMHKKKRGCNSHAQQNPTHYSLLNTFYSSVSYFKVEVYESSDKIDYRNVLDFTDCVGVECPLLCMSTLSVFGQMVANVSKHGCIYRDWKLCFVACVSCSR